MRKNHMKISNVHNAYIYTVVPTNIRPLLRQRLRWVFGFMKNAIDYRRMFFRPQYGNLGMIVLPAAGFSIFSTVFFFIYRVWGWVKSLISKITEISTIGFHAGHFNLDFFYFNTNIIIFVSVIAITGVVFIIMASRKLAEEKTKFGFDSVLYLLFYTLLAPFWMVWALYNLVFVRQTKWR
jgi:cellulose synthase/poly-beta-1,6-N-acetylglucosamine synthase-like glycosyltransferase